MTNTFRNVSPLDYVISYCCWVFFKKEKKQCISAPAYIQKRVNFCHLTAKVKQVFPDFFFQLLTKSAHALPRFKSTLEGEEVLRNVQQPWLSYQQSARRAATDPSMCLQSSKSLRPRGISAIPESTGKTQCDQFG